MNGRRIAELERLYAQLPEVGCKGLCTDSCGPVIASEVEQYRIVKRTGIRLNPHTAMDTLQSSSRTCPLLRDGRCSAYKLRPLLCRLFGAVDHELMRCPHGCVPERWLTYEQGHALLSRNEAI